MTQQIEAARQERLQGEERDTTTIAGMFSEALGNIEDAIHHLQQVNEQYEAEQHDGARRWGFVDDMRPVICNPALDFWLQAEFAEDKLKSILAKLQRVEPLAPKEVEA